MVASAIRGKRGQGLLTGLLSALDSIQEKALVVGELEEDGDVCALGALGVARGLDISKIDPEDPGQVAAAFDIAPCLAQEIVYLNDECGDRNETPEQRWKRMREWVAAKLRAGQELR